VNSAIAKAEQKAREREAELAEEQATAAEPPSEDLNYLTDELPSMGLTPAALTFEGNIEGLFTLASFQDSYARSLDRSEAEAIARGTGQNPQEVYLALRGGASFLDAAVGGPLEAFERISWMGTFDDPGPARILREFRLGDGPGRRVLFPGSSFSSEFAASPSTRNVVRRALEEWKARYGGMRAQGGTFTDGRATFGVGRFLMATEGMNAAAHIIGSFNYEGRLVAPNRIEWTATNDMSLRSYFYSGPVQNLQRPARYGTTTQVIIWQTDVNGRLVQ